MATYSGGMKLKAKFNLNNDQMKVINNVISKEVTKASNAGLAAMKELRTKIVTEWFGEFNAESMIENTKYEVAGIKQTKDKIVITINSYVDEVEYDSYKSRHADRWHDKWGGDMNPGAYILDLQLNQGIIGLPEKTTFRKDISWTNDHFHKMDNTLQEALDNELKKEWQKEVRKQYNLLK